MLKYTLQGISNYEYRLELDKANETIEYIKNDNKFPENGGRDRLWEFIKINFIDSKFAQVKLLFWNELLKWETEEIGKFYNDFKGDTEMRKIMDAGIDILKMARRLYDIKPNCKKYASKDYGCRGWYLEAINNFLRPFIEYEPKLRQLDDYLSIKFNVKLEDLDYDNAKIIIKNFLFRNRLPLSIPILSPTQPTTPIQPIAPTTPQKPVFTPPSETTPEIPKAPEQITEPAKAGFDLNKFLPYILVVLTILFITKR